MKRRALLFFVALSTSSSSFRQSIRWRSTDFRGISSIGAPFSPIHPSNEMSEDYFHECNRFLTIRVQKDGTNAPLSKKGPVQWKCCRCNQWSLVGYKKCIHCKAEAHHSHRQAFAPVRQVVVFSGPWVCEECGMENPKAPTQASNPTLSRTKFFCSGCGSPFNGVKVWTCPTCYSLNARGSAQCSTCFQDRPISWNCSKCNKQLSIFTCRCSACNYEAPSQKTKGTQSCTNCGTLNDSRSELCETCVAPLDNLQSMFCARNDTYKKQPKTPFLEENKADSPCEPERKETKIDSSPDASHSNSLLNGAWWCRNCNIVLRRNATFCDICLQSRGGSSNSLAQPPVTTFPGDWQCPYCRQFRRVNTTICCGKPRVCPTGYWLCQKCCSTNRNERQQCLGCACSPPDKVWKCTTCGSSNEVDSFLCGTCYSPHPVLWSCAGCMKSNHYTVSTCECGMRRILPPNPIICSVCGAPNAPPRKSCFRCRGRLVSGRWICSECHNETNSRTSMRCELCRTPRKFNMAQITWVCDVCSTAIDSGGDLPVRLQCPKCNSMFTDYCLKFPSRWVCKKCKLEGNRSTSPNCMECGQRRKLSPFTCPAVCPHCFNRVVLDEREECSSCCESLSALLTEPGELVQGMKELSGNSRVQFEPTELVGEKGNSYWEEEMSI